MTSGCGTVGRADASQIERPPFDSGLRQLSSEQLFTHNCIEKV